MIRYLLIFLLLFPASLFAQENDLSMNHILPGNSRWENEMGEIFQDSRGFLWFCSRGGLYRHDGTAFMNFQGNPWKYLNLGHSRVTSIVESADQRIWIGTQNGLFIYDPSLDTISLIQHVPNDERSLSSNYILSIFKDSSGNLWIGTGEEVLNKLDPDQTNSGSAGSLSISRYHLESQSRINTIKETSDGLLWIGTDQGLCVFDPKTERFIDNKVYRDLNILIGNNKVEKILIDSNGIFWISLEKEEDKCILIRYDQSNQEEIDLTDIITSEALKKNIEFKDWNIDNIIEDPKGFLWICLNTGLLKYNGEIGEAQFYIDSNYDFYDNSNSYNCIFIDRSGVFWFGTGEGIKKSLSLKYNFNKVSNKFDNGRINVRQFRDFHVDSSGNLYFASTLRSGGVHVIKPDQNIEHIVGEWCYTICQDPDKPDKILWFTDNTKLCKYNIDTGDLKYINEGKIKGRDFNLHIGTGGYLWIGTDAGLYKMNRKTEELKFYTHEAGNSSSLSSQIVVTIYSDREGFLWVGTEGGLNRLDPENEKFLRFQHDPEDRNSISSDHIYSIFEDSTGIFWIGTFQGGLNRLDPEANQFKHYNSLDGLPDNTIYGVMEDEYGYLWISTDGGLSRFDPGNELFYNFDVSYGLQGNEFDRYSYYKSNTGEMYFGGVSGFNHFYPDDIIPENEPGPPVVLVDFVLGEAPVKIGEEINGRELLSKSIDFTDKIELTYNENFFTIEFVALDFADPDKNSYAYMLEGFDNTWRYIGNTKTASFTKVPPGDYTFKLKAANNNGTWNEEGTSLIISISPPFWDALWFKVLGIFILMGTVTGIVHMRMKNMRKQTKLLRINVEERTRDLEIAKEEAESAKMAAEDANKAKSIFLANMSHEIRTPMNAVLGFSELLEDTEIDSQQRDYLDSIRSSGKTLLSLINDVLDISKIEAGKLELQLNPVDLKVICNEIKNAFEWKIKEKNLDFTLDIDSELPGSLLLDEIRIRQILFNLVGNAVKFTENGYVKLSLIKAYKDKDESKLDLIFTIEDSGIGISEKQQKLIFEAFRQQEGQDIKKFGGTGLGLAITKRVVEILGGKITVESQSAIGSKFNVELKNVAVASVAPEEYEADNKSKEIKFQKAKILIVDDIDINRTLLIDYLKPYDFSLIEAKDGKQTIEMALKHKPHLILLDMKMPVMDGYEAVSVIRNTDQIKNIPIVAVSASSLKGEEKTIDDIGCNGLVRKPAARKDILEQLKRFIDYHEVEDDEQSTAEEPIKEDLLSEESKARLHEIVEILENDMFKKYETLKKTFVIDEIGEFAISLTELGNTYNLNTLVSFGEKLNENVQSFNVEQIQNLLDDYPELVETIKKRDNKTQ